MADLSGGIPIFGVFMLMRFIRPLSAPIRKIQEIRNPPPNKDEYVPRGSKEVVEKHQAWIDKRAPGIIDKYLKGQHFGEHAISLATVLEHVWNVGQANEKSFIQKLNPAPVPKKLMDTIKRKPAPTPEKQELIKAGEIPLAALERHFIKKKDETPRQSHQFKNEREFKSALGELVHMGILVKKFRNKYAFTETGLYLLNEMTGCVPQKDLSAGKLNGIRKDFTIRFREQNYADYP